MRGLSSIYDVIYITRLQIGHIRYAPYQMSDPSARLIATTKGQTMSTTRVSPLAYWCEICDGPCATTYCKWEYATVCAACHDWSRCAC